jgi:hypothetical protein
MNYLGCALSLTMLLVPEHGHKDAASVTWLSPFIQLSQVLHAVNWILGRNPPSEAPSFHRIHVVEDN